MRNFYFLVLVFLGLSLPLISQEWAFEDITVYTSFDDFEEVLTHKDDKTYIINFWATWCGPCVKELPYFEALGQKYASKNVEMVLVSLDFEKQLESKLLPFLNKHKIESEVVVLLDKKESAWIDRVDPSWTGSIPITIIYNKNSRAFFEKAFHSMEELEQELSVILNHK